MNISVFTTRVPTPPSVETYVINTRDGKTISGKVEAVDPNLGIVVVDGETIDVENIVSFNTTLP